MPRNSVVLIVLIIAVGAILIYFLRSSPVAQQADSISKTFKSSVPGTDASSAEEEKSKSNIETAPVMTGAKLDLDSSGDHDVIRVAPKAKGREDAKITFLYEWTKNGQLAADGDSIGGIKRGDKLSVKITPFDGKLYGLSETYSIEVKNTTPRISEIKEITTGENSLTYQVVANDADGDALSYSMVDAPKGMMIDQNGIIRWSFGKEDYGKTIKAKVKVSDGHGGETEGNINFQLGSK